MIPTFVCHRCHTNSKCEEPVLVKNVRDNVHLVICKCGGCKRIKSKYVTSYPQHKLSFLPDNIKLDQKEYYLNEVEGVKFLSCIPT